MSSRIPLVADVVFHYVLGSEESEQGLRSFLSAVQTDSGFAPLAEVEITNPFSLRRFEIDKQSIIDVKAKDEAGRRYTIEVQVRAQPAFAERALYYWAKSYGDQLHKAEE